MKDVLHSEILLATAHPHSTPPRAVLIAVFLPLVQVLTNAGQANAATGAQGYADSMACAKAMAEALQVSTDEVLLQSTGVIGRPMKMDSFIPAIPELPASLGSSVEDAHRSAVAITTTGKLQKWVGWHSRTDMYSAAS